MILLLIYNMIHDSIKETICIILDKKGFSTLEII